MDNPHEMNHDDKNLSSGVSFAVNPSISNDIKRDVNKNVAIAKSKSLASSIDPFLHVTFSYTSDNRVLKRNTSCFGNMGFGGTKKANKKSFSVLKGPSVDIPQESLMEHFERHLSSGRIKSEHEAIQMHNKPPFNYKFFNESANLVAHALQKTLYHKYDNQNVNKDLVIAVCVPTVLKYRLPLIFAILKLGATYLPINLDYPEEKIRTFLDQCKVIASVISKTDTKRVKIFENLKKYRITGPILYVENLSKENPKMKKGVQFPPEKIFEIANSEYRQPKYRTACILPSFSNTGVYKGIRYSSRAILNLMIWDYKEFSCDKTQEVDNCLSNFVDSPDCMEAIKEIFFTLLTGKTLIIIPTHILTHPVNLLNMICSYQVSKLVVYPRLLQHILSAAEMFGMEYARKIFEKLKVCICIGETVSIELANLFFHYAGHDKQLTILYGHDENASTVIYQSYTSLNALKRLEYCNYLPIGKPINNFRVYLVSPSMNLVPVGVVGEIYISAPILEEMYNFCENSRSEIIKNTFKKPKSKDYEYLLRTGDFGRIIDNRLVYETGKNNHVYIDEHYFNLDEVTSLLNKWISLINVYHIFLCYQDERDPVPKLTAFVDFKNKIEDHRSAVLYYLEKKLPPWAIPDIVPVNSVSQDNSSTNSIITSMLEEHEEQKTKRREYDGWENMNLISQEEIKAAKVLLLLLANMMPVSVQELATNLTKSIVQFGATSYTNVKIVQQLSKVGYKVKMEDIDNSQTLLEIISKMVEQMSTVGVVELVLNKPKITDSYQLIVTTNKDKNEFIEALAHSYTRKDSLGYYSQIEPKEIKKYLEKQWPIFTQRFLSLTLKRLKDKKIVGGILNVDWNDKTPYQGKSLPIYQRLEFQAYLESGFHIENFSKESNVRVLQISHLGLLSNLLHLSELYEITNKMLSETIDLAKSHLYNAVLITVYDSYVAELCEHVWGFKLIRDFQANAFYTADEFQPYGEAPDSLICQFMIKEL